MQMRHFSLMAAVALALAGCAGSDEEPRLMNAGSELNTPDDFSVLPTKPLQMPENLSALPAPTPGGNNLADPTPMADAVAALGGNPAALSRGGVPAGDTGLVNYAGRFGRDGSIRQTLASEDLTFRRANDGRLLERLFNVNVYLRAYRVYALDAYAELERWRRAGARTPSAPPAPVKK